MVTFLKKYSSIRKHKTLSNDLQLRFLKRLLRLMENGYPLITALEMLKWDRSLAATASHIIQLLKNGLTIDQAMEKAHFHPNISGHLYFIRTNNDLTGSIRKCLEMHEHRLMHMKKFKRVVRYPLILFSIFALLLFFIKQSVLPAFMDLLQSNQSASSTVLFSMKVINIFSSAFFIGCLLIVGGYFYWKIYKRKFPIEKQIKFYRALPIIRRYLRINTSFLFAFHFSSLLKTGMPFKEIFLHISHQKKIPILAFYAQEMTKALNKGLYINHIFGQFDFLEADLANIFQKNADVQALGKDLAAYAEILTEELKARIVKIIAFLQPISFLVLACFIIFIYLTLMWPMFQLIQSV